MTNISLSIGCENIITNYSDFLGEETGNHDLEQESELLEEERIDHLSSLQNIHLFNILLALFLRISIDSHSDFKRSDAFCRFALSYLSMYQ